MILEAVLLKLWQSHLCAPNCVVAGHEENASMMIMNDAYNMIGTRLMKRSVTPWELKTTDPTPPAMEGYDLTVSACSLERTAASTFRTCISQETHFRILRLPKIAEWPQDCPTVD